MQSEREAVFVQRTSTDVNSVFDYSGELSIMGLNIILAYDYGYGDCSRSESQTISSISDYVPDAAYLSLLNTREKSTRNISGLLYFSIATHLALIRICLVYYSNRGLKKDDHCIPMFTGQLFGSTSLVALITEFSAADKKQRQ